MDKNEAFEFCEKHCEQMPEFMRAFMHLWSRLIEATELNYHQAVITLFISAKKTCKMGELASHLKLSPGAVTQVVDPLVAKGYLERSHDQNDRRVVIVNATNKAFDYAKKVKNRQVTLMREMFLSLSLEEAQSLVNAVTKLVNALETVDIQQIIQEADSNLLAGKGICM